MIGNPVSRLRAVRRQRRCVAMALLALLLVAGCSSSGGRHSPECVPRKGMNAEILVRCGCFPARSGGGSVMVQGYGQNISEAITLVHYICPRGGGTLDRVAVVNGVVDRVLY